MPSQSQIEDRLLVINANHQARIKDTWDSHSAQMRQAFAIVARADEFWGSTEFLRISDLRVREGWDYGRLKAAWDDEMSAIEGYLSLERHEAILRQEYNNRLDRVIALYEELKVSYQPLVGNPGPFKSVAYAIGALEAEKDAAVHKIRLELSSELQFVGTRHNSRNMRELFAHMFRR